MALGFQESGVTTKGQPDEQSQLYDKGKDRQVVAPRT